MPNACRVGDPISCGDAMAQGSPTVFINNIAHTRIDVDQTAGHCYPPVVLSSGSPDVFTNNIPSARVTDPIIPHCCGNSCHGGNVAAGSPNVFINS
jgi:uncharacterized Zn-binding protein involved in type VI secretion